MVCGVTVCVCVVDVDVVAVATVGRNVEKKRVVQRKETENTKQETVVQRRLGFSQCAAVASAVHRGVLRVCPCIKYFIFI